MQKFKKQISKYIQNNIHFKSLEEQTKANSYFYLAELVSESIFYNEPWSVDVQLQELDKKLTANIMHGFTKINIKVVANKDCISLYKTEKNSTELVKKRITYQPVGEFLLESKTVVRKKEIEKHATATSTESVYNNLGERIKMNQSKKTIDNLYEKVKIGISLKTKSKNNTSKYL